MTVHRVMTFGKLVCDMDPKTLTLLIDSVRPAGTDKPADCVMCAGAIKAASAPRAQLVRDTVRSVPRCNSIADTASGICDGLVKDGQCAQPGRHR